MKNLFTSLCIAFCIISCKPEFKKAQHIPSKIDTINTDKQAESYIRLIKGYEFFNLELKYDPKYFSDSLCKIISDSLKLKNGFFKADFDNNGYTDLLFTGRNKEIFTIIENEIYYSYPKKVSVVMNFGKNSLQIHNVIKNHPAESIVANVIKQDNGRELLEIYMPDLTTDWYEKKKGPRSDKAILTYLNNDFIEYNDNVKNYEIEKIELSTSPCNGTCPIFDLVINHNGTSIFRAKHYNFYDTKEEFTLTEEGLFKANIQKDKYIEIVNLLNYLDFPSLSDSYSDGSTGQSCELKITYNNGDIKRIYDNGLAGTYGLKKLYRLIFDLRENQKWNKSQKTKD